MKSKEELKKLFENGDKPTQEEFWEWQDSYWHKDEKLPTENTGIYKIKGSVPDKVALDTMTSMVEGDVYNLLDTGDNYVYVLDLNNTGEAGWDKLGGSFIGSFIPLTGTEVGKPLTGMIEIDSEKGLIKKGNTNDPNEYSITLNDFSGVKLESPSSNLVVSNGGVSFSTGGTGNSANFGVNSVSGQVLFNVENANYRANHIINNNTEITELTDKVSTEEVQFIKSIEEGITSDKDFTDVINPLAYVQKKYVDDNISLQTVLDNSSVATNPNNNNTARIDLENGNFGMMLYGQDKFSMFLGTNNNYLFTCNDSTLGGVGLALVPNQVYLDVRNPFGESSKVNMSAEQALYYDNDYSAKFTDRSLVDKGYVDNAISGSTPTSTLQTVLEKGSTASNANSNYTFNLADANQNSYINLNQRSDDNQYSTSFTQTIDSVGDPDNGYATINLDVINPGRSVGVRLGRNALYYIGDYSAFFNESSLVPKGYVDSKTLKDSIVFDLPSGITGGASYRTFENYAIVDFDLQADTAGGLKILTTENSHGFGAFNKLVAVETISGGEVRYIRIKGGGNGQGLFIGKAFDSDDDFEFYLKEVMVTPFAGAVVDP